MGLANHGEGVAGEPALVGLGKLRAQYRGDTGKVRRVGVASFGYDPCAIHLFATGRTATGGDMHHPAPPLQPIDARAVLAILDPDNRRHGLAKPEVRTHSGWRRIPRAPVACDRRSHMTDDVVRV